MDHPRQDDCCRKCGNPNNGQDHFECPTECQECGFLYARDRETCPNCEAHEFIENRDVEVVECLKDHLMSAGTSAIQPLVRQCMDANGEAYTVRFHKSFNKVPMADNANEVFLLLTRKPDHEFVPNRNRGDFGPCEDCGFARGHNIHKKIITATTLN